MNRLAFREHLVKLARVCTTVAIINQPLLNLAIYVGYFYPDGIIKYDGSSMPRIDGTISKKILLFSFTKIKRKDISIG